MVKRALHVLVGEPEWNALERAAKKEGTTVTAVVRRLIRVFLMNAPAMVLACLLFACGGAPSDSISPDTMAVVQDETPDAGPAAAPEAAAAITVDDAGPDGGADAADEPIVPLFFPAPVSWEDGGPSGCQPVAEDPGWQTLVVDQPTCPGPTGTIADVHGPCPPPGTPNVEYFVCPPWGGNVVWQGSTGPRTEGQSNGCTLANNDQLVVVYGCPNTLGLYCP
jgi:hypothetical protein